MDSGEGRCVDEDSMAEDAERECVSGGTNAAALLSAAELVAKARAPVKKEFLRTPGDRLAVVNTASTPAIAESQNTTASKVSTTKKSKRQQKKERQV
ncbi:hypothetical protein L7F22_032202, partial [Adiantum nelumboides]|nr:hypothetical protein [Adiantum nelumboides]